MRDRFPASWPPRSAGPDLRNFYLLGRLVRTRQTDHGAVRHRRRGGVAASKAHAGGWEPPLGRRIEEVRIAKPTAVIEMATAYQQASVNQKGVTAAEDHCGAGNCAEAPVRRIVELRISDSAPGEHSTGREQVQMNCDNRPGERRRPFSRFGLRLLGRCQTCRGAVLHRLAGFVTAGKLEGTPVQRGESNDAGRCSFRREGEYRRSLWFRAPRNVPAGRESSDCGARIDCRRDIEP